MLASVDIKLDTAGYGTIKVDGVDFSNKVSGVSFMFVAGRPAEIILTMPIKTIEAEIEGNAQIVMERMIKEGQETAENKYISADYVQRLNNLASGWHEGIDCE